MRMGRFWIGGMIGWWCCDCWCRRRQHRYRSCSNRSCCLQAMNPLDDIRTPRLILRHMSDEVMAACLRGELGRAERMLGIRIPAELLDRPTSLQYGLARWADDCRYEPWSMRAVVLPQDSAMIGHVRFHSSPDPEYLRRYARGAVEFGYCIFRDYRRHGYATEAAVAVMEWA